MKAPGLRYVVVDCEMVDESGVRRHWRHVVDERSVDETIRIVESSNPGAKAKARS